MSRDNLYDAPESGPRFRVVLAEIWHDWLEAISDVAYQTHRTCEFLAENTNPSTLKHDPFDAYSHQSEGANSSIDMKKLEECLRSMDSMQAARVIHAVQMMQAMEAMLQRRRSRANEEAAW
jgi:replicative superfamily II helicase